MAMIASWLKIDEERVVEGLQDAGRKLDGLEREVVLDFSSVRRIDPSVVRALEELAGIAEDKGVKIALRGLNVDVYKVLKLVKLASRFIFVN
ncbi:MAG: STAS domain-containing protein [Terriglobales bacterium]